MKRRDLENQLKILNVIYSHDGGKHDIFVRQSDGKKIPVPRHKEIKERTAQRILKEARG